MANKKTKCCPDIEALKEMKHLQKVFGTDLSQYSHSGYERTQLPYTVRDATKRE